MADDELYYLDSVYNSTRDAWEIGFAYMVNDEEVSGRYKSVKVTVNVAGYRKDEPGAKQLAVKKARDLLVEASKAKLEE